MQKKLEPQAGRKKLPANVIKPPRRKPRIRIKILFLVMGCCFSLLVNANPARDSVKMKDHVVKGKVSDEKGEPLPGVTVLLDSTKVGVTTGTDGTFQMKLNRNRGVLVFSFIGFETVKRNFMAGKTLNVILKEKISGLDEVTVVAYGSQRKRDVVGAMSVVKGGRF